MIRIGIFFGGPSREREISFAGGKTAFEHLDKQLFLPVPIFVDGFGRFVLLKHEHMYAPDIRAFYQYPEFNSDRLYIESFPELKKQDLPSEIGSLLNPTSFSEHFDFAFLAMHGPDCEDGGIQGLLEWYRIPYSGPGLLGSSVGIDKILQNKMLSTVTGQQKATELVTFDEWQIQENQEGIFKRVKEKTGLPVVIKAPHQGSSIGVVIVRDDDFSAFSAGINQCFFAFRLSKKTWDQMASNEKQEWTRSQANLETGVGYPLYINGEEIRLPGQLLMEIERKFENNTDDLLLLSADFEPIALCEEFIEGQEFSCGCIQLENGKYVALPPTEIIKVDKVFDFNSKYKPGGTRKRIPVQTSLENNLRIQDHVVNAAESLAMNVCVRIDGFLTGKGDVILHDPNTVPGMSPASLIFKQMAEIGLNITESLTYLIRQSLNTRINTAKNTVAQRDLLSRLDNAMAKKTNIKRPVESKVIEVTDEDYLHARKWYARLCAEGTSEPEVLLKANPDTLTKLPVQLLFKDYIEDVLKALQADTDLLITDARQKCREITRHYAGNVNFEPEHRPMQV